MVLQIGASFNQTNVSLWVIDLGVCMIHCQNFFQSVCFYLLNEFGTGLSSGFSLSILVEGERCDVTGE